MVRAKQFTNFFHNFVVMKKSVNFLPEKKQADLKQLVGLVREHVKNVGMVILYGSYARNTYVDYDQRVEFGVPTYFMSDYDILILTRKPIGAIEYSLYDKIADAFFQHKNRPFHTKPQFINYGINDFNYALSKGHYFETEIKREGVILYDSGEYKLERRRKLNFDEITERAQKYYNDKFVSAFRFFETTKFDHDKTWYKLASFQLHQATEHALRTVELVFALYSPKEHKLTELMNRCKRFTTEIFKALPRETPEDERLFKLLERAYVESRYNPDFEITKEDIDALLPKVKMLLDIVEKVCTAQIDYYSQQSEK